MKFTISLDVDAARLRERIPPELHAQLPPAGVARAFDLVVFAPSESVVHGSLAAKASKRLAGRDGTRPLLAVARGFTEEALAALRERGAEFVTLSGFHWTDTSHQSIKTLIAAKIKAPDHR